MGAAAKALDLEIAVAGVERIADRRRRRRRPAEAEHARVPGLAGEAVGILTSRGRPFGLGSYRCAEKIFARLRRHLPSLPVTAPTINRYCLGPDEGGTTVSWSMPIALVLTSVAETLVRVVPTSPKGSTISWHSCCRHCVPPMQRTCCLVNSFIFGKKFWSYHFVRQQERRR